MSKIEDRELLELAAKAGGYRVGRCRELPHQCLVLVNDKGEPTNPGWNSLIDDGDCARLEAELSLDVVWGTDGVLVVFRGGASSAREKYNHHDGDRQAARRRASTRAAAEIGRSM
jgi:hypothetical protein